MRRCEHGVMIAKGDTKAFYCSGCNPGGGGFVPRTVVLPDSRKHHAGLYANKGERAGFGCPKCRCIIYVQLDGTKRQCGDCDYVYRAKAVRALQEEEQEA